MLLNSGGTFLYLNIWVADEGDGGWGFLFRQRTRQAIAWTSAFGGTGAALVFGGGGGGSGGTVGGATGTGTAGVATVQVTDTGGRTAPITLNAGYKTYYQNETGLGLDIYYYLDGGTNKPTLGSSADNQVASMVITQNGTATVSSPGLAGVTTYSGGGSTASTGTSGGSGVATVIINDNAGHRADLTLNQGYRDFYGSGNNTSLVCNIYYYADPGNNNTPTIGSSADSQITSMVITRNGTTTVASGGLAGVTTYA